MKKMYVKPTMDVVVYGMTQVICTSNQVKSVDSSDTGLHYGGGGNGPAHSKDRGGIWDED